MICIEQATVDDIPHIKRVLSDTWVATYSHFLSVETVQHITSNWHHPQRLQAEINNPNLFVGVAKLSDGTVVGVVTLGRLDHDTIMLHRLYVDPTYQRQGIGEQLLQAGKAAFPAARNLRLNVEAQNHIGRSFYRKQGFQESGTTQEHIGNDQITIIEMEKKLV